MIRVAAVGDLHYDRRSRADLRQYFSGLSARADLLLIAGDLTQSGAIEEVRALASDLEEVSVPVALVLGNHDFHQDQEREIMNYLRERGIAALEGETATFDIRGMSVGIVGMKGFGGGFFGACITDFGERETKQFARHARTQAELLDGRLRELDTDFKFALLHFSPVEGTLLGEKREIYPFLGSYLLAEALDSAGADAAFHGHAHHGVERGATPGGIPVRNVALTVIRHAYNVYSFEGSRRRTEQPRAVPASP
ncbi:MAG: metallophosphoesterase [Oligoflexia bacterium]|nr:metallophosphoesterase [Oligoflexia bacterium]